MNKALKFALPVVFLVVAVAIWAVLFAFKPEVVHRPVEIKHPMVSVKEVAAKSMSIPVMTRGSVTPGTEIHLTSEVGGQVLEVSENMASGGFFRKGETLVRIDTLEYDVNIKRAEASVAQAKQQMAQAEAEKTARSRVQGGNRSQLATYEIQYRQAVANYEAAKAELQAAKMQRGRTVIKAPFDGRVRMKSVDVGQYVRPGMQLAVIYAVDVAEIRLPLSDRQLALVDVPLSFTADDQGRTPVRIVSEFGGKRYFWEGSVVRAEGGLDERNRLLYVVAQVDDPYALDPEQPGRPPLTSGFFIEAMIEGRHFDNVIPVPRRALRNSDQVWVVDNDNRLERRSVDVIYKGKESIYVRSGLQSGDRVVLSQLDIAVEGMQVRPALEPDTRDESVEESLLSMSGGSRSASPAQSSSSSSASPTTNQPTGHTQQFTREQLMAMAKDAKDHYDRLDESTREQLKDLAGKAQDLANAAQAKPERSSPAPTAQAAPASQQGASSTARPEREMSPLAALIDDEVQQTEPEQPAAQPNTERAPTPSGSTLSAASAPRLLKESVQ